MHEEHIKLEEFAAKLIVEHETDNERKEKDHENQITRLKSEISKLHKKYKNPYKKETT